MQTVNVTVTYEGAEHEVKANSADLIQFDLLRAKHGLPSHEEGQFAFLATVCFAAMRRTGQIPTGTKLPEFLNKVEGLEPEEAEEENDEAVFPETDD
ncbi:hypothetical protein F7P69_00790 [Cellulosimicrobium funkei]|nr:hypothetical protein [Cellulosimicrobium funkei]